MSDLPIPGSVHLVGLYDGVSEDKIILHPRPSRDANDPLNWSKGRKHVAAFCLFVYVLTAGMGTTALYSVLTPIYEDTGISISTLNAGTGYILGLGGFINQPLAMTFGKRPIFLTSLLGNVGMCMWMPYIKSEGEWIANKILQGFFVTPIESLVEIAITDLYFAHERVTYIGLYAMSLFGSNYLAPLVAGFIADGQGWKWVMYWSAIWNAGGFIILFFLMEETNYIRVAEPESRAADSIDEKGEGVVRTDTVPDELDLETHCSGGFPLVGTPKSYAARIALFNHRFASNRELLNQAWRPILLLRFPILVWAGILYGSALVWYNVLNATASTILSAAPYNFPASTVGAMYASALIGAICSGFYAGWFGDRFAIWFARRRRGVREPEHRLWLLSACVILCPVGLILWGVGASEDIRWIGLAFGMGFSACSTGIAAVLLLDYALDAYKELGGKVMIIVITIRNCPSFAIGYGITPWQNLGLRDCFISAAFVGLAVDLSYLIPLRWGKAWRIRSSEQYWHYVKQSCLRCRDLKKKCDETADSCLRCANASIPCLYPALPTRRSSSSTHTAARAAGWGAPVDDTVSAAELGAQEGLPQMSNGGDLYDLRDAVREDDMVLTPNRALISELLDGFLAPDSQSGATSTPPQLALNLSPVPLPLAETSAWSGWDPLDFSDGFAALEPTSAPTRVAYSQGQVPQKVMDVLLTFSSANGLSGLFLHSVVASKAQLLKYF
ncbi:hypothetical protein Q5752_005294 [Cryptotrichosporon argae]